MIRKTFVLFFFLWPALIALSGCSSDQPVAANTPEVVRGFSVARAQTGKVPDLLEAVGTVRAAQSSQLASQVMGTITDIRVREGDRVQRGEVLAVIDDAQARANVDRATAAELAARNEVTAAETELTLAESTLKRYQSLYDKKSVSPQEFDEVKAREQAAVAHRDVAKAGEEQAKAALAGSQTALEYTRIRAPFDGVVTERKLDPGAMASPGLPLLSVEDVRRYRLEAMVNENDLRYVHMGQRVSAAIDALGGTALTGRVAQIVPAADPASRSFLIKVDLPRNQQLRSGLFGTAQFSRGEKQALLVPQSAVVQRGQLQSVYVLDANGVATLRYVTVGKTSGAQMEVLAGIQSGDVFVTDPGDAELTGKRIEAAQ
jgi:RND family efflux transporter MFP subunit